MGIFLATFIQSSSACTPIIFAASVAYCKTAFAAALVNASLSIFSAHSSAATTFFISYFPTPFLSTLLAQKSAVSFKICQPFSFNQSLSCVTQ